MRNKVAKQLRKDARKLAQGQPWESYEKVNEHDVLVFNYQMIQPEVCSVYTQMLGACGKAVYKSIKQRYKAGKLQKAA